MFMKRETPTAEIIAVLEKKLIEKRIERRR